MHAGTEPALEYFAEIDVSLDLSSGCVVDTNGIILREAKVPAFLTLRSCLFRGLGFAIERIGPAAAPPSQWLHVALTQSMFVVAFLETHHTPAALAFSTS